MKQYDNISLDIADGMATLTFRRPSTLNAMNRAMMDEIIDALKTINGMRTVNVAVITGEGRAFMAGADIKEYAAQTDEAFRSFQENGLELYRLIEESHLPFLAAVNGFALGGGFEIALACDFIIASESSKFGLPEVHLGLIPGGGGTQRLLLRLGMNRVKEMLMLGGSYPAAIMKEWGIVSAVAPDNDFEATVLEWTNKLKRRPAQSIKTIKGMLQPDMLERMFRDRLAYEKDAVAKLFGSPLAAELIRSFTEKQK